MVSNLEDIYHVALVFPLSRATCEFHGSWTLWMLWCEYHDAVKSWRIWIGGQYLSYGITRGIKMFLSWTKHYIFYFLISIFIFEKIWLYLQFYVKRLRFCQPVIWKIAFRNEGRPARQKGALGVMDIMKYTTWTWIIRYILRVVERTQLRSPLYN